jgi:hypothetical protein
LLILLTLLPGFLFWPIVSYPSASIPTWIDQDDREASEYDLLSRSDAESTDLAEFAKYVPVGFTRNGYSMQGAGSAVEWIGDYVYLAAASVLQVYYAPLGARPELIHEIELRDWVREMDIAENTLFLAARGDGLYAFDLGNARRSGVGTL